MRHGFGATTYTCSASGRWARTACAPRPTRTIRPCAAASAITRSVSWTIAASSTNSLSITSHPSSAATRRATSEPPEAYCRVIVMTGGAISGLQVLAQVADVEKRQPALGGDEDDQVARALHVVQHFDPLLGERFGGERLVEEPLLLGLEAGDLDPVALRLDLLLLRDLVVDRLHHLGRGLQGTEKEGRNRRDPEVPAAGAGPRHEGGVDQPLHRVRDLGALGDVVDRVLHHAVAHALADGVEHGAADLVFVADLREDLGRLHRVDLPADRHFNVPPHLLARQGLDGFDLLSVCRPLLFARRVPLDD